MKHMKYKDSKQSGKNKNTGVEEDYSRLQEQKT